MRRIRRHEQHALALRGLPPAPPPTRTVVLPTPPLPPKKRMRLSRAKSRVSSAARHAADWRAVHAHAPVPGVELLEEERVDVEQIDRRGVRQARRAP